MSNTAGPPGPATPCPSSSISSNSKSSRRDNKQKHSEKFSEKPSRRYLENCIKLLQVQVAQQTDLIKKLMSPQANVSTQNNYEELMIEEEEEIQIPEEDNEMPALVPSPTPNDKLNLTLPVKTQKNTNNKSTKVTIKRPATPQSTDNAKRSKPAPSSSPTTAIKSRKPPPIVGTNLNCKSVADVLSKEIGSDAFKFRHAGKSTYINTNTLADYKKVCHILQSSNAEHHTFTPKEEQHINIVLRHMNSSYDETDIKASLESLSLDIVIVKVMLLPTKYNNKLWLIQLKAGSNAKQLIDLKYLLHQKVQFEHKKKTGIAQCKNCQLFGHSARNCNHKFRCVKCTEDHGPGQCPRTLDPQLVANTPAKCVNCKADHPANFRGCPVYAKVIERKQTQHPVSKSTPLTPAPRSALRTEGVSFAAVLAPQAHISTPQPMNPLEFLDNESKKYFNVDMSVLHSKFKTFYPQYIALPEDKRAMALLGFTMSLST